MVLDPLVDDSGNLEVVLLDHGEVTVARDVAVGQLDPIRVAAGLLQELDHTVVVGDMHTGLAGQGEVRHAGNVGQLAGGLSLEVAPAEGKGVVANPLAERKRHALLALVHGIR